MFDIEQYICLHVYSYVCTQLNLIRRSHSHTLSTQGVWECDIYQVTVCLLDRYIVKVISKFSSLELCYSDYSSKRVRG